MAVYFVRIFFINGLMIAVFLIHRLSMENEVEISEPAEKKQKTFDYTICIVCQKSPRNSKAVVPKDATTFKKSVICMKDRMDNGDPSYVEIWTALKHNSLCNTFESLIEIGGCWHSACYKKVTHAANIAALKKRFSELKSSSDINLLSKLGRPSKKDESSVPKSSRGSRIDNFNKELCVFCKDISGGNSVHQASTQTMTQQLQSIAKCTSDDTVRSRLSILIGSVDPFAARTFDMKYHLPCFVAAQRNSLKGAGDCESEPHLQML